MRTIREMLGNDEKVWVYLDNEETWKRFADMAEEEGFCFGELSVEKWVFGHAVAVHSSGDMGHLPLFVWCRAFSAGVMNCPRRIDFKRYIEGYEDHQCRQSHFRMNLRFDCSSVKC